MFNELLVCREPNTEFRLVGADGKTKKLWNENRLGKALRLMIGEVRIPFLTGGYGDVMYHHNLIANTGHAAANGRITNQGSYSAFVNIAIGVNTSTANALDCALGQEITTLGGQRSAATASQVTTTITNDTSLLSHTFTFTGSFAITEEGIFDSATGSVVTTTTQSRINSDTSVTVTSGAGIANSDFLQWDNEIVQVTAGGGTGTLTITRAQKGTTAASHSSGVGLTDFTASGGTMLAKQSFAVVNTSSGDSLTVSHKLQS